jgi:anti-sigma-K factor RskA
VDVPAQQHEADGPGAPSWDDIRRAVMVATEVCATAFVTLALRGPHGAHTAAMASQAVAALRDIGAQLTVLHDRDFNEATVQLERARAAAEALAAAGIPQPRPPHLHAV